ncbi:hypothetical protein SMACR_04850 [Sordaria macrospora]|uniref:WGS project CABT00000000 data, contig 2.1 n=2 Tax=Sordaria macrospora TaxID=5147 RepID=F7VLT0_SORMK|nr:uncharacterized protein SMAC_04850 [Sordaria macrospora k-hell]KAA8634359.1 hypothetical protein SMACR_04850 [Sordaria macrospora]CCC06458.1 unnamed protein product [Sordaria macrospora k-hell]
MRAIQAGTVLTSFLLSSLPFTLSQLVLPSDLPGVWEYDGCYTEVDRTIGAAAYADDEDMTNEACISFCTARGFQYAGTQYAQECYCGESIASTALKLEDSQCNMACKGNATEPCGGPSKLSIFYSSAAVGPQANPGVNGFSHLGCYSEGTTGRTLTFAVGTIPGATMTVDKCTAACNTSGYKYAGVEFGGECFCGNRISNGGAPATSGCNMLCNGNTTEFCGGGNRLNIYIKGDLPPTSTVSGIIAIPSSAVPEPPGPAQPASVGNYVWYGCRTEATGNRALSAAVSATDEMTLEACSAFCSAYTYFGVEYSRECYCGNSFNAGSVAAPDSDCSMTCAGKPSEYCGAGNRLSVYAKNGTEPPSTTVISSSAVPSSFPQATGLPEGWAYKGCWSEGTTGRLLNHQAPDSQTNSQVTVEGKVNFLSKWGTGPANETGAYELDLSKIGTNAAFRELHLKTDVFCAGGVTLPDKVGRQLTVGGWSGDSTYGTRLYWPGHDWEENVNELSLQAGRWYPSAMVMANGSIFVIGGETGSNAAAVPSIEVLPYTGTKPLFMDWLERTDPNNLYPFVAVLPSGGIFVQYWNEARILDERTFATIKELPMVPGAVNDPQSGRTYPLEGAAVLLPQRYPYSENLGILICGGSNNGPGYALDNCVSTRPDDANPKWVIERMPSFRVMPCMAPLPDGTYLIANGAHHGFAGFGLANNPNKNALLYDPTKPVGSRITVMANTTIARMYHSEAITLLDGRVLISGSDPQDNVNPEEYRVEVFVPPYLLNGKPRPSFTLQNRDWDWDQKNIPFNLGSAAKNGAITVTLLGSVSSTHGNSMGARTLMPNVQCQGTSCTVDAPPNAHIAPPGWYQFFVLDGGVPAVGVYVRIGGDPAGLGNWPNSDGFSKPGV